MATVYSLICWGGLTGKTVSISASTDVVTLTNHGLRNGAKLWPSGTLPAELNTSTPVYARSTGANTFTLHASEAGAIANTEQITFAGSSTYAAVVLKSDLVASPSTALSTYGLSDLSRWGSSGSERVYDSIRSWNTARSGANESDTEHLEVGEAFDDKGAASYTVSVPASRVVIKTAINGQRTPGFHGGIIGAGYVFECIGAATAFIAAAGSYRIEINGFSVVSSSAGSQSCVVLNGTMCSAISIIAYAKGTKTSGTAITLGGALSAAHNCIALDHYRGFITGTPYGYIASNCIATKCVIGFGYQSTSSQRGFFYNNISVGNTTNWTAQPTLFESAGYNAGEVGDTPWYIGTNTSLVLATSDFVDWANNDFRPASVLSPQVDVGYGFYGYLAYDITDGDRPNYNNGGAASIDIGCFEFDHGYGPWPSTHTLTLTNVVVGSRVFIRDQANTTTHYDQIAAASTVVINVTVYGDARDNWRIKIRKASAAPYYQAYETLMTAAAGSSSIYVNQLPN